MVRRIIVILVTILSGITTAQDSLTVLGKIVDLDGNGVENAKIISEDNMIVFTDDNGEYSINLSKDIVPVDNQDFIIPKYDNYSITIYNLLGQKIFDQSYQFSDFTTFIWDGMNKSGGKVSSGIYFSILEMNNQVVARNKITIVDQKVLNNRPFTRQTTVPKLSKVSDYTYDAQFNLEGENFTNISNHTVMIEYNGNNDNMSKAKDIVLNTYEIDYIEDIDGNTYKTVKIGDQWWMAENLKVTRYRNGEAIPNITNATEWINLNSGAYCIYNNDEYNADTFGYLYNWYAVNDSRNIAPSGWHVPTDEELEELAQYINDDNGGNNKDYKGDWYNVGTHLKSTAGWNKGGNGRDDYGFTVLPSGSRNHYGSFYYMGKLANFWSASETNSTHAWHRFLYYYDSIIGRFYHIKVYGFSVRCVRD